MEEFKRIADLNEQNEKTLWRTEIEWQAELDGDLKVVEIDNRAGHELLMEHYGGKVRRVNGQESYDKVFDEFYKIIWLTARVIQNAEMYQRGIYRVIEELEKIPDSVCPCCGAKISDDFYTFQRLKIDDVQKQIDFYESFFESRVKELERLQIRAEKIGCKMHGTGWLKAILSKEGFFRGWSDEAGKVCV